LSTSELKEKHSLENTQLNTPRMVREYPFPLVLHVEDILTIEKNACIRKLEKKHTANTLA
jgi:hypothetical protein